MASYFSEIHQPTEVNQIVFCGIEHIPKHTCLGNQKLKLRKRESYWIYKVGTVGAGPNMDHDIQTFLKDL